MLFQKIRGHISDLFQDSMAGLMERSMYARPSKVQKSSSLARRVSDLADTAAAHVVAVGVLVRMEPKMAQDAKDLIQSKKARGDNEQT